MSDDPVLKRRVQRLVNISSLGTVVLILVSLIAVPFWHRWEGLGRAVVVLGALTALILIVVPIAILKRMSRPGHDG